MPETGRLETAAYVLGFDMSDARAHLRAARHAYPNEDDETHLTIAIDSMRRMSQARTMERFKVGIGAQKTYTLGRDPDAS